MLNKILETKKEEIIALKKKYSSTPLDTNNDIQAFYQALSKPDIAIIAEIKQASPSKGLLTENFNVGEIASDYMKGGAAALSVLTDQQYFAGDPQNIMKAKQHCTLPVLRKDFIIDPIQIIQSQHLGANAILLIVAALSPSQLQDLHQMATELKLATLIECHSEQEIEIALNCQPQLIGINNRNLSTFKTDLNTTLQLKKMLPAGSQVVTESGIISPADIKMMLDNDVNCFLIGESLIKSSDRCEAVASLLKATQ